MDEDQQRLKREHEDMIRCAAYLIQMIEKYGAEIMAEKKEEKTGKNA